MMRDYYLALSHGGNRQEPPSIRWNTVANYSGTACQAILGFLFVPLYIRYLGIESYGLVGFSVSLYAVLRLTDLGLSSTLSREFARYSILPESAAQMRDLLKTAQTVYWGISLLVGCLVVIVAPLIAKHWLNTGSLGVATVQKAVMLMGLTTALQGPTSLYIGGIFGLQRHVLGNGINVMLAVLRSGGVVLALALLSPTIITFFACQLFFAVIGALGTGMVLWNILPNRDTPSRFQILLLRSVWRFAAGMSITSILWLLLSQLDKVILSKMLPLQMFGYYMVAVTAAAATSYLSAPLYISFLPRYTQLLAAGDEDGLRATYRISCRLNALAIIPTVTLLALFSRQALLVWTHNPAVAEQAHLLLSLLVIGYGLNQLAYLPYGLQVASGWVKLGVYTNTGAVFFIVPALVVAARFYGGIGAAAVWIALNCIYVFIYVNVLHGRVLQGEARHWYAGVLLPLFLAVGIGFLGRMLLLDVSGIWLVFYVGLLWMLVVGVVSLTTPSIRKMIMPMLSRH